VEGAPAPEADLTRALYEQYANQIFRYCLHQLGSREEAEDAVQSTFLNAFRGIKRGVVPETESAWLFAIAHNVCLSRRRTSWRRGRIESPTDFDVVEELAPAPSRRADELMGLQDVLEQMPENQRRAILLREWQGLSYREIADELELSQAAVETLIFRARRSLAAGLEQPPETKRRIVRGTDVGNILAGLKALLLGGGAAAKVAATVAVVSAGTVVAAAPVQQHRPHPTPAPAAPAPAAPARASGTAAPSGAAAGTASPAAAAPAKATVAPAHLWRIRSHVAGPTSAPAVPDAGTSAAAPPTLAPVDTGPPTPVPAPPASEPAAAPPAAAPPAAAPRGAPTPAPAATTTSDKSKTEASSAGPSQGTSESPGTSGQNVKGDKSGKSDSKGTDSEQPKGTVSEQPKGTVTTPGATTLPVVTAPVTPTTPPTTQTTPDQPTSQRSGSQSSGDKRTIRPAPASPTVTVTVSAPAPAPASGSSTGTDDSQTPPAAVSTPQTTVTPATTPATTVTPLTRTLSKETSSDTETPSGGDNAPVDGGNHH
jgi:RNA polymerase sigma factor (sigma-70 family)